MEIFEIVIVIINIAIGLFLAYLYSYVKKKADNLATKEDVSEITRQIEVVKHEYSSKLESVKTALGARLFTHQVRYQNEFNLLVSLSEKVAALRAALANFEIVVVSNQANEDNFSETKQEAEKTLVAIGALMREYEAHKPFYPEEIYESMLELHKLSWFEFVLQADRGNVVERNTAFKTAVDVLRKKSQSSDGDGTSETIDKIYEAIRKRVQYWEGL